MFWPAVTDAGVPVLVTARSAVALAVVVAELELLPALASVVVLVTAAEFVTAPVVAAGTVTTTWNTSGVPALGAMPPAVVAVAVPPAMVNVSGPLVLVNDWIVPPVGTSVSVT